MAGPSSSPLTSGLEADGPPLGLTIVAAPCGADSSAKRPAERSRARIARTSRAFLRHTPSRRKSNPGISHRGCRLSWAVTTGGGRNAHNRAVTPRIRTTCVTTIDLREERLIRVFAGNLGYYS